MLRSGRVVKGLPTGRTSLHRIGVISRFHSLTPKKTKEKRTVALSPGFVIHRGTWPLLGVEFSSCDNQFLVSHDNCSSKPRGEK